MRMVVVTGLSGSGRSAALKAFEDMGYYCVDNLPLVLLPIFADFAERSEEATRSAIGIDIREKDFPERFPVLYRRTESGRDSRSKHCFSMQRTRRLCAGSARPGGRIRSRTGPRPHRRHQEQERAALAEVKKLADRIIDTSDYTVHDLRQAIERHYAKGDAGRPMLITIITFGYKYGVPYRHGPHVRSAVSPESAFRSRTQGADRRGPSGQGVRDGSRGFPGISGKAAGFLTYLLPRYRREGKSYLTIGFGCTGGRHRSVAVAITMAEALRESGYEVNLKHRDIAGTGVVR